MLSLNRETSLPNKVHPLPFAFALGVVGVATSVYLPQHPRHVVGQGAHGLHALGVKCGHCRLFQKISSVHISIRFILRKNTLFSANENRRKGQETLAAVIQSHSSKTSITLACLVRKLYIFSVLIHAAKIQKNERIILNLTQKNE